MGAEQFGTNIRATVATTAPNVVRGLLVPMNAAVQFLKPDLGLRYAALSVGLLLLVVAFVSNSFLEETHNKDLDYEEF